MGFIQRELDKIAVALREPRSAEEYSQLYAAQLALSWAIDPDMFAEPYGFILGKAADSTNCPSEFGQALS
jgi:hypothetical protein